MSGVAVTLLLLATGCATVRPAPPRAGPPAPPLGAEQRGLASWYGEPYHGRRTASGETYDMHALTAAHRTLPFGTVVQVTHLRTGRSVEVRINDRGPHVAGRILDLSHAAARAVGLHEGGIDRVRLRVVTLPDGTRAPARDSAPPAMPVEAPSGEPPSPSRPVGSPAVR